METKTEVQEIMERLEKSNESQAKYAKGQFLLSLLAALFCIAALLLVLSLVPKVNGLVTQFETVSAEVMELAEQGSGLMTELETNLASLEGSIENLDVISGQLADSDLQGMVENVNELAVSSQKNIGDAVQKLDAIDFDTLNKAIKDLAAVVEPLAKFFNVFN